MSENKPKRRIHQNAWGNWNGYEGTRRVIEFGCNGTKYDGTLHDELQEWLDGKSESQQAYVLCEPDPSLIEILARIR